MVQVSPINVKNINFKSANYNAVKIQINDPKTNLPENMQINGSNDGRFEAVNIEVNRPVVDVISKTYSYPESKEVVTAEQANIKPIEVPPLPVNPIAYQSDVINEAEVENIPSEEKKNNDLNDDNELVIIDKSNVFSSTSVETLSSSSSSSLSKSIYLKHSSRRSPVPLP